MKYNLTILSLIFLNTLDASVKLEFKNPENWKQQTHYTNNLTADSINYQTIDLPKDFEVPHGKDPINLFLNAATSEMQAFQNKNIPIKKFEHKGHTFGKKENVYPNGDVLEVYLFKKELTIHLFVILHRGSKKQDLFSAIKITK